MSNMSYCRFENTLGDLRDCEEALRQSDDDLANLSDSERRHALWLIKTCQRIANGSADILEACK